MSRWVGVDVGGTFTDLIAIDPGGNIEARKVLSTPGDQSEGVLAALASLGDDGIARFAHGTTVATNMLLERRGARVAFCVTEGFTDLLYLRRQNRASLYDLTADHPEPLAQRDLTVAVPERVEPQGVTRPLTRAAAAAIAEQVAGLEPDIVAVMLLHSYREPSHEQLLRAELMRWLPQVDVVLSSDVYPEVREYERAATTTAEAYLRPGVARYLAALQDRLRTAVASPKRVGVMTSSGGMRDIAEATERASQLALSGPAGGVVAAAALARQLELPRVLTIDIGGTSADVGLIIDGAPLVEPGGTVASVPIALPRVLVETVSAGGGSIASVDAGGALRVGPRSAGAVPGPVAFGRGGTQPTLTDAHVVLGRISDTRMSGGVSLDAAAARRALQDIARGLHQRVDRVAEAIVATADATMARALRRVSVERGVDPRECTLVAFGGAGPLHACGLADMLGIRTVIVPPHAGSFSALGLAITAERREAMVSVMTRLDGWNRVDRVRLMRSLSESIPPVLRHRSWIARMRYAGQGHELDIPVRLADTTAVIARSFERAHVARYGFQLAVPMEVVSLRHVAEGAARHVAFGRVSRRARPTTGPKAIALPDATLFVATGWHARPMSDAGWRLERA
ncbi:MAG TPA: hydantoinase/oxoprolinase family protein [Gemmatimonadaceae bacterium]|nr:hydantoinase/oxoprolinase family protein [Gemmatimonadaceae bacterium]